MDPASGATTIQTGEEVWRATRSVGMLEELGEGRTAGRQDVGCQSSAGGPHREWESRWGEGGSLTALAGLQHALQVAEGA